MEEETPRDQLYGVAPIEYQGFRGIRNSICFVVNNQLSDLIPYVATQIFGIENIKKIIFLTEYSIQSVQIKYKI